jgi:hypothetical protein
MKGNALKKTIGLSMALAAGMFILVTPAFSAITIAETPVPAGQGISVQATEPPPTVLTVLGQITNGTRGGSLPVTLTVTLYAVDGQNLAFTSQGTADASGKVRFDNVAYKTGRAYALAAAKGGVQYHSDLVRPKDGERTLALPFQIYDTTADASRVRVTEMYVVGQFLSDKELQMTNAYILSNEGDRAVEGGEKTADGQRATLRFYLPAGAANVEFQGDDGTKFARTEDGFVTKWGVPPGTNAAQVVMRYTLPYTGQLHLVTRTRYPVQKVNVWMADQGITLTSAALVDQGTQAGADGVARRTYVGNALAAGASLTFGLSGMPKVTSPAPVPSTNGAPPVIPATKAPQADKRLLGEVVVGVGLLVILVACLWRLIASRSRSVDPLGEHRALFEALADLDEDHEAGRIGDPEYDDQRSFLKAALLAALQDPAGPIEAAAEGQA